MGRNQRDEPMFQFAFTNLTEDASIDCNAAVATIGDGLGTLAKELINAGVISGTTA